MRLTAFVVALLFVAVSPVAAQRYGPAPDPTTQQELLLLRERAWRTYFSNDTAGFKAVVPDELLAVGWGGGEWEDREATLAGMAAFAAQHKTLVSLEFPHNVFQQYGDAVILYTTFRLVLRAPDGKDEATSGRGTEIFVKRRGRWIHTGWHLDTVAP